MKVKNITLEIHDATFYVVTEHIRESYPEHKVKKIEQLWSNKCWKVELTLDPDCE